MKTINTLIKAAAVGITGAIVGGIIYGAGWLNGAITVAAAGSNDKSDKAEDTGGDESSKDSCDKSGPDIQLL